MISATASTLITSVSAPSSHTMTTRVAFLHIERVVETHLAHTVSELTGVAIAAVGEHQSERNACRDAAFDDKLR